MQSENQLETIILQMQKRYTKFAEILRLTQELDEALKRNDRESADMLIQMRGQEMEAVSEMREEIAYRIASLPNVQQTAIEFALYDEEDKEIKRICELKERSQSILEKARDIDRHMNIRVAGKDSYYAQEQTAD